MKNLLRATLSGTLLLTTVLAAEVIKVDEKFILKSIESNPPSIGQIQAAYLSSKAQESEVHDSFQTQLVGTSGYSKSTEKAFSSFIPVTANAKNIKFGLEKNLKTGMKVGVNTFAEEFSNGTVDKAATTGFGVSFSMDLYKDFMGRLTKSQLQALKFGSKKAHLEKKIQTKAFVISLRKIYWSIVANNEALSVSQNLLSTANKQLANAKKRFKDRVADSGEVARYHSQVSSRKATIIGLKYDRESLIQALKEMLPEISDQEVQLSAYNLDKTVGDVLACTALIQSKTHVPMDYTFYDEVLDNVKKQYTAQKRVTDGHNRWDVKLSSELNKVGKKIGGFSNAYDDFSEDSQTNYAVGFALTIPLGSQKNNTEKLKSILDKKRFHAQQEQIVGKLNAYHTQVVRSVGLLQEVVRNQKMNSKYLGESLRVTRKKYNQARISVRDLINDEDALLKSNLDEIGTKLKVVNTLLDYLAVYTETPCKLNL